MWLTCKHPYKVDFSDWEFSTDDELNEIIQVKVLEAFRETYKDHEMYALMAEEHGRQPGGFLDIKIHPPFAHEDAFYTLSFEGLMKELIEVWSDDGEISEYAQVTAKNMANVLRDLAALLETEICGEQK